MFPEITKIVIKNPATLGEILLARKHSDSTWKCKLCDYMSESRVAMLNHCRHDHVEMK